MKVLVTGARGMLGTDVCSEFTRSGHDVVATDLAELDITDARQAAEIVRGASPHLVVHCAAYADVDGCERDPDLAFKANAIGSGNIASACNAIGASIIAISTDFVFDGKAHQPYTEFDPIGPLGAYGRSKAAGEAMIRAACPRHQIVRTAWLYGANGKCFPKTMIAAARTRSELKVVADQTGSPTYTVDLARALVQLAGLKLCGTFHLTNTGQCTWHELAVAAIELAGITGVSVLPISSSDWPTPTERPKYSVMRPYVWELSGMPAMRHWREALAVFVTELD